MSITRACVVAATAAVAALVLAPAASAKKYDVDALMVGTSEGTKSSGTITDRALGRCTFHGVMRIPEYFVTWKCRGGSLKMTATATTGASDDIRFTVKVDGGTGRFKGAKGTGTGAGKISAGRFRYRLKVRT
jgi:hypothetical protein